MGQDPLILLLESKQIEVELISKSEKLKLLIQWRNIFAKKLVEMNRKNVIDNRDIEIFRRSLLSYVVDSEAIEEYMRLPDTQCVILSSDDSPGLTLSKKPPYDLKRFCLEGARPWGLGSAGGGRTYSESEILVFSKDFAWTLAMDEITSYFAFRPCF